jgi:hypothetical protein
MMISPGTPRIQSRSGTIVASFRRGTMRSGQSKPWRGSPGPRVVGLADASRTHNSPIGALPAGLPAELAHRWAKLR